MVEQQIGNVKAGRMLAGEEGMMYKHNPESLEEMWKEVGLVTGFEWEVRATLDPRLKISQNK
jgi:hypothetical protein